MSEHERDMLIARVADGDASESDWAAFRAQAERDPAMWRELAELQRDAHELAAAVNRAIAVADDVEAPIGAHLGARLTERFRLVATWGGWAAAAAVVLMWSTGWSAAPQTGAPRAGLIPRMGTPQEALQEYLTCGQRAGVVIDQVPEMVMLDARPAPEGAGFHVVYIRQIMERAVVPDLYQFGVDAAGQPASVRLRLVPAPQEPF